MQRSSVQCRGCSRPAVSAAWLGKRRQPRCIASSAYSDEPLPEVSDAPVKRGYTSPFAFREDEYHRTASRQRDVDPRAHEGYLEALSQCQSIHEVSLMARQRIEGRSATEFGATLQAIRRLKPLGQEKAKRSNQETQLYKGLLREFKKEVKKLPPRTLANALYLVAELRIADKGLMSKAVQGVSRCVKTQPGAFKSIELAQIAAAYRMMAFKNEKLNGVLETAIMNLPEEELAPGTAVDLMHDLSRLNHRHRPLFERLASAALSSDGPMHPNHIRRSLRALTYWTPGAFPNQNGFLKRIQEEIVKNRPDFIGAVTAATIVCELHDLKALDQGTGRFLCDILNAENQFRNRHLRFIAQKTFKILQQEGHKPTFKPPNLHVSKKEQNQQAAEKQAKLQGAQKRLSDMSAPAPQYEALDWEPVHDDGSRQHQAPRMSSPSDSESDVW